MQIACPSCAAEYDVPDARAKPGRKARCSRCGTEWTLSAAAEPEPVPVSDAAEPEPAPLPSPAITAMDRLAAARSHPPRSAALVAAWLLTLLLLAGGAASAIIWRAGIARAWPPSGRILLLFDHLPEKSADMPDQK